ncbi:6011_t:CDS:1, partial [Acaulospora morrowiae]
NIERDGLAKEFSFKIRRASKYAGHNHLWASHETSTKESHGDWTNHCF